MKKPLPHPPALAAVARAVRWHRRSLAALCAFAAVFFGLNSAQPAPSPTVAVIAAARDLPGGTVLAEGDLVEVRLPAEAAPAGAAPRPDAWVGRTLNAPLTQRSVVTEANVADSASLVGAGLVAVAVPVTDAALLPVIQLGTKVDIWGGHPAAALASSARVVALPTSRNGTGPLSSGSGAGSLLVEVSPAAAAKIAAAGESNVRLSVH